ALMNPWKAQPGMNPAARLTKINVFCQTCHDSDNDVHWNFQKRWADIAHPTPRNAAQQPAEGNPGPAEAAPAENAVQPPQPEPLQPINNGPFPQAGTPIPQGVPPGAPTPPQTPQRRFFLNPSNLFPRRQ